MLNDYESSKRGHDNSYLINRSRVSAVSTKENANLASTPTSRSQISEDRLDYIQLEKDVPVLVAAVAQAAVPSWTSMILMVSLIFGGCCANVFALEAIIKEQPTAGPLITFAQFAICALFTIPSFLSPSAGPQALFLNPRGIPLRSWVIYTAYFVSVNLLNNWAFAYKISVPLHIILRSAGPVASMVIGYVYNGKLYSRGQIASVGLLTVGVAAAAMADAQSKGVSIHVNSDAADTMTTVMGFTILALAMVLSAFQGIYADRLYATYGRGHWKEALFYSHALSLPLFLTSCPQLLGQWRVVASSPSLLSHLDSDLWVSKSAVRSTVFSMLGWICQVEAVEALLAHLPVQVAFLAMNALTQYLCIRGVHLLSARSSSLTVTIFLNVRKLVSLLLSIYLFGNHLARGVLGGAALVFVGGGLYGFEGARLRSVAKKAQ
ncbi:UPD-GlcNAc transporter (Mnn2-2), putative [Penicillium digitatum PHI26]|uniref:UPD-GlcNAc transporter (Mnn2-2), putative n=2 Tax=Penicillium digitatum TaxID=36651 RepID=K9FQV7_PEND2|nr:UPD-GlcNAc transporter (Mnn2-2), putative [Penicillium digitatum Pd1]EKV11564.1 UPD-GlcNAc transporter (Mnn2-2), putative [Penicillium digitatum PHI26]EKV14814.1 UPD-GlcNAc transporter (Mnn2-2), putative [Penicillium digitatum Pd1]